MLDREESRHTRALAPPRARQLYFVLADISGYTSFLSSVEQAHGVDLSGDMPVGYELLGRLIDEVVRGLKPEFEIVKIEGDAVFAVAPSETLDGRGESVLQLLIAAHRQFRAARDEQARSASDHVCTACPVVSRLDLKYVLHRGTAVQVDALTHGELHGPAVTVAHRLLKNGVEARIGAHPYILMTDAAATGLGISQVGMEHAEDYPALGRIGGRIVEIL